MMTIHLNIKRPIYRSYLKYLFESTPDEVLKVTKIVDFGKVLCSFVDYSNQPVPMDVVEETVRLSLPANDSLASAKNYHLYYSKESERRINDMLEVLFNIDFDRYYLAGRKVGQKQKDIINSFVITRKLCGIDTVFENAKKRNYRNELELLTTRSKQLANLAYHRNEKIKFVLDSVPTYSKNIFS